MVLSPSVRVSPPCATSAKPTARFSSYCCRPLGGRCDIAAVVGLSVPAVSDRVARLQEVGVINRFTLDVERSHLRDGIPVLIGRSVAVAGSGVGAVKEALLDDDAVAHEFTTAEADLVLNARVTDNDVASWRTDTLGTAHSGTSGCPSWQRLTGHRTRVKRSLASPVPSAGRRSTARDRRPVTTVCRTSSVVHRVRPDLRRQPTNYGRVLIERA